MGSSADLSSTRLWADADGRAATRGWMPIAGRPAVSSGLRQLLYRSFGLSRTATLRGIGCSQAANPRDVRHRRARFF